MFRYINVTVPLAQDPDVTDLVVVAKKTVSLVIALAVLENLN